MAGNTIYSMTEFEDHLWSAMSVGMIGRTRDNGVTWDVLPYFQRESIRVYMTGKCTIPHCTRRVRKGLADGTRT